MPGAVTPDVEHALALGVVIVTARIELDGAIGIAVGHEIGAAQILDGVFQIVFRIEQA